MRSHQKRPRRCCEICDQPGTWRDAYNGYLCGRHYQKIMYHDPRYHTQRGRWSKLEILLCALGCTAQQYGQHLMELAGAESVVDYVKRMDAIRYTAKNETKHTGGNKK